MCRLCGITATEIVHPDADSWLKMDLIHELMVRSVNDEGGQHDGWGITDGTEVWKSAERYINSTPYWRTRIDPSGYLLSHIRKASVGTGMTVNESHPYVFDVGGHQLIGVHNGFIDGSPWGIPYDREQPNTDSWKAYKQLAELIEHNGSPADLNADLFNEWLHPYTTASHYAFMMLWRGDLYAMRGSTRTLHFAEIGNGFIIHTTQPAVEFARRYVDELYGVKPSVTWKMNDNTCIRFKLGSTNYQSFAIQPNHVAKYVVSNYNQGKSEAVKPTENNGATDITPNGIDVIVAPSVTRPRIKASSPTADTAPTLKEKRDKWKTLAGNLSPMRANLLRYWLSDVFKITDANGNPTRNLLLSVSMKDLEVVEAVLTPLDQEGNRLRPFVQTTCMMLNHWNHVVNPEHDMDAHELIFGNQFFWLDRRWTHIGVQEIDPYLAFPAWASAFHKVILHAIEQKPEVERYFDLAKVKDDILIVQ